MATHNADNERIKRRYFVFLKEAKRQSEDSVDAVAKALARFEAATRYRDFKAFHFEQAVAFKKHLAEQNSLTTGGKLSKATLHATLAHLKRFFQWLADKPGYKSRLQYSDAEYFNLSEKDSRVATARRGRSAPTLEQVRHVISLMPERTDIERRNRALVAFTLMTGARDSALASMKLKHVDIATGSVFQDAREVETKFSKSFTTYFFNVGDEVRQIFDVGHSPAPGEAMGQRRPAVPGDAGGVGRNAAVRGGGPGTQTLEHGVADPRDLPKRLRIGRPSLLQSAQHPHHPCPAWPDAVPGRGAVQSVESEHGPRRRADDVHQLRHCRAAPAGPDHPGACGRGRRVPGRRGSCTGSGPRGTGSPDASRATLTGVALGLPHSCTTQR